MISFTLKGVVWLVSKGVTGARKLHKRIVKFLNKKDKRFPSRNDYDDGSYKPAEPEDAARLNALLGIVGKKME